MKLIELLPDYYQKSAETADLQNAIGVEIEKARAAADDLLAQLNVDTATWGLNLWENAYGLQAQVSESLDIRRRRIKSKRRAIGTTTVEKIRSTAQSFSDSDGIVEVTEHNPEYRFEIRYIETLGLPPDMKDLTAAIEEIKPAHLAYGVCLEDRVPATIYTAAVSKLGITMTLYPWQIHQYESDCTIRTAAAIKSCLSVTVLERS